MHPLSGLRLDGSKFDNGLLGPAPLLLMMKASVTWALFLTLKVRMVHSTLLIQPRKDA